MNNLKIGDCLERTIATIENKLDENGQPEKQIHYNGFSWSVDDNKCIFNEYCFFVAPLIQALAYDKGILGFESDMSEFIKQYGDEYTDEQITDIYNEYDNGKPPTPIKVSKINLDTPCGCYLLIDDRNKAFVAKNDNETVKTNSTFTHEWIIQNNSEKTWKNNKLVFVNEPLTNLLANKHYINVPETKPGETVTLKTIIKTKNIANTVKCQWRMVDEKGMITHDVDLFDFNVTITN